MDEEDDEKPMKWLKMMIKKNNNKVRWIEKSENVSNKIAENDEMDELVKKNEQDCLEDKVEILEKVESEKLDESIENVDSVNDVEIFDTEELVYAKDEEKNEEPVERKEQVNALFENQEQGELVEPIEMEELKETKEPVDVRPLFQDLQLFDTEEPIETEEPLKSVGLEENKNSVETQDLVKTTELVEAEEMVVTKEQDYAEESIANDRHNMTKELDDSNLQKDIEKYEAEKTLIVVSDMNQPKTDEIFQTDSSCDDDSLRTTFESVEDGFLDIIDEFDTDNEDKTSRNVSDLNYEDNLHVCIDKRKTKRSELDEIMIEGYFKRVKYKEVKIEKLITKNTEAAPGPGNMIYFPFYNTEQIL